MSAGARSLKASDAFWTVMPARFVLFNPVLTRAMMMFHFVQSDP